MTAIVAHFHGPLEGFQLDADFEIPARGVTALFGQSGCGKTTVLRCLAGLERMDKGSLTVNGEVWEDENTFLETHQRPVGYVFQEASLFPHLTVRGNLDFAVKRCLNGADAPAFDEVVDLLGLGDLLERHPAKLSGGERQRVAIARALLSGPKLLLMDEPLAALDKFSKDEIIPFLERLNDNLDLPVIFVSHDTNEVERLADHMVLMEKGRVTASGPLLDMLSDPTLFIAGSQKTASVLETTITAFDEQDRLSELEFDGGKINLAGKIGEIGQGCRIRIAARDVSLAVDRPSKTTILNVLPATILDIHPVDDGRINVLLSAGEGEGGARFIARITLRSLNQFKFKKGQKVFAQVKSVSMVAPKR